ncbi:hypothetical protein TI05_07405 [Achromatium sp. WMS3]|nr:hypothetical protein TI05_07405 [Achromatium sp. WMS3]
MQQDRELLLKTVQSLNNWLKNRLAQDAKLQETLTNIEENLQKIAIEPISNQFNIADNLPKVETVDTPGDLQIPVSIEKLDALRSKWDTNVIQNSTSKNTSVTQPILLSPDPEHIEHIRKCLNLKSEAFCLQVDRLEDPEAPTELAQAKLITKANELGTRLWIFDVAPAFCSYPEQLADLSTLFAICADSSGILADLLRHEQDCEDDILKECIELIAEVQSMLKTALERVTFGHPDSDQRRLFSVILDLTDQRHIYIDRHMKTDDPAEPSQLHGFKIRLDAFVKRVTIRRIKRQHALSQEKTIKNVKGQIEYHRKLLEKGSRDVERDWQRIADALTQWSENGLKPDDPKLRTTLMPVGHLLPSTAETEAQKFIRAYLQSWDVEDENEEDNDEQHEIETTDDTAINRVAAWLRGQTIVFIGGDERPHAKMALINAFALKDVIWVSTRPHETLEILKTPIRRDEVGLVVLTIRWASHAYGNIRTLCRQLGKPFIRLPAGYNPHRVAYEVIDQASEYFC